MKGLFEVQKDYIASFGSELDVWIIKDTESGRPLKDKKGSIEWFRDKEEAKEKADELNINRIFEKIVLS